jgi:Tol biopolymer transport system component
MRHARVWLGSSVLLACGLASTVHAGLSEFGIEGMGIVSTPHSEVRASVSPDGRRIVWGSSDRPGGPAGRDLWQARRVDGRWQDPEPLSINTPSKDYDPMFSGDGRWLYFFSDRPGGLGNEDLYRAAVLDDGGYGPAENLGPGVNTSGSEWAPTPSRDGQHLMFASDGRGGAGGQDLWIARWDGKAFVDPQPVPGINTEADEFDATWLGDGRAIVFTRSDDVKTKAVRLFVAQCDGSQYGQAELLPLSFNSEDSFTYGPVIDWNKPGELLLNGTAKSPKAGKQDIYRMKAPAVTGQGGCVADAVLKEGRQRALPRIR